MKVLGWRRWATGVVVIGLTAACTGPSADVSAIASRGEDPAPPAIGSSTASAPAPLRSSPSTVQPSTDSPPLSDLVERYRSAGVIDIHNHDASDSKYLSMLDTWKRDAVSHVVLFGDASEPSAIKTDAVAWDAYQAHPDLFWPSFSGFDLHQKSSLDVVRRNLERGYFGLGEIVAASTYSPAVSRVAWKATDPMDGYLPEIYDICAQYRVPILLHIDPPSGAPIDALVQALDAHPHTIFVFAHINAYSSPTLARALLRAHPNLYADFDPAVTASISGYGTSEEYADLVKEFPDRFFVSTDSGYGLDSEEFAIDAVYRFLDLVGDPSVVRRIAHENYARIVEAEPATDMQRAALRRAGATPAAALKKVDAGRELIRLGVRL